MTVAESAPRPVLRYERGSVTSADDRVAVEEPLEIRLVQGGEEQSVGVTMRTPGADHDLVRGFLYAEGAISGPEDVLGISESVQNWVCGIVNPSEPWEGVGDGPESWMSNRNLAGAKQVVAA